MTRGKPNPKHLGLPARLKRARKAAGMTTNALALAAKVTHLSRIEDGQTIPRIDAVEKLASVLKVSPCHLAFGAEREEGPTDTARLGARLKEARERAALSCNALGKQSSVSGQTVANIEDRGMMPGVDTAEQLAKALGVSPCWLAFGEPAEEQSAAETQPAAKTDGAQAEPSAALTAKDLEPLVDRLSPEERQRLVDYALRGRAKEGPRFGAPRPGARRRRTSV